MLSWIFDFCLKYVYHKVDLNILIRMKVFVIYNFFIFNPVWRFLTKPFYDTLFLKMWSQGYWLWGLKVYFN